MNNVYAQLCGILALCYMCLGDHVRNDADIEGPRVKTKSGTVIGEYKTVLNNNMVASFQGIPYAKPPVKNKRFKKPEPIDPWDDILVAKKKPPACMQYSSRRYNWIPSDLPKSEDCLYLNVWVPESQTGKFPVMVWIYGGGYSAGASSMDIYDGSVLATVGNVIVVNMNYRLGVFGFLNSGTSDAPGNAGLFDILLALKWVNENIENFGGDPQSITIFGESAGSISVNFLIISPLSQGLFQKAIMQSGSSYLNIAEDDVVTAKGKLTSFSLIVGCTGRTTHSVVTCLRNKNATILAHAENIMTSKVAFYFIASYGNNEFLPDSPINMIKSKNYQDIPLLIGTVKDEATIVFLNYIFPYIFPKYSEPITSLIDIKYITQSIFPKLPIQSLDNILKFKDSGDATQVLSNLLSDITFNCPSLYFSETVSEAYYYWMTHRSLKNKHANWTGVEHVSDVLFVFGKPFIDIDDFTDEDRFFSANMMTKWSTFAHTGYPLSNDKSWPKLEAKNPKAYELNAGKEGVIPFPRKEVCEILRPLITT